jgi:hypothetical protein
MSVMIKFKTTMHIQGDSFFYFFSAKLYIKNFSLAIKD